MKKKILSLVLIMTMATLSVVPSFAEEIKETKNKEHKIENQVTGKITAIDSNYVTIDVATPNKKEKNETNKSAEKRTKDDMFTLTGESKKISISQAKFIGSKKVKNSDNANNTEKTKTLTYSDFAIGDYVQVVLADDGSNVAKIVKKAGVVRKKPNYENRQKN